MNQFDQQWRKLTTLARQAGDDRDTAAPYGFATRAATLAGGIPASTEWAPFERFAFRGFVVAAAFGLASIAFNYSVFSSDQSDIFATGTTDSVVELLGIS